MKRFLTGFFNFLFPPMCAGCKKKLVHGETLVCTFCFGSFPETDSHTLAENPFTRRFIGKTTLVYGVALYSLKKKSLLEQVLFAMKYKNQPKIGELLGNYYGNILKNSPIAENTDAIIPIPLHPKRLYERGYNQSDFFAQGLATVLELPLYLDCIKRVRNTPSQTRKNQEERMLNVKDAFKVEQPGLIAQKHLLLVDDILTTGATLVACAQTLLEQGASAVSVAAIAMVED